MSSNLVSPQWLNDHLEEKNITIVDCSFDLRNPDIGHQAYVREHIPGAVYVDLEKDLSSNVKKHGGRHPLPSINHFVNTLNRLGIDSTKHVICYDNQGGAMASRLWWMLKYVGHQNVSILEVGFTVWKKQGYPVTAHIPSQTATNFTPVIQHQMLVTKDDVKEKLRNNQTLLIDSRAHVRYTGEKEEVDPVAGHIPGAVNEDWQNRLLATGEWKSKNQIKEDFKKYRHTNKEIIVYCGSGVTACTNILALAEIGIQSRLYAGSWSDWISYKNHPIAVTKDENH
ncbi:sulfurtransferase [Evansella halocellulosilytica]|uniref:sulfurtransferase n=1 Tax=Evansella halocellulosilytica TaxID=2011013 RepID=UPI0027B8A9FC|nr:sulfurtransferase [Evansella halocellulosilytica]